MNGRMFISPKDQGLASTPFIGPKTVFSSGECAPGKIQLTAKTLASFFAAVKEVLHPFS
jgi:hypothetical protein